MDGFEKEYYYVRMDGWNKIVTDYKKNDYGPVWISILFTAYSPSVIIMIRAYV